LEQFENVGQAVDFIASAPFLEDILIWTVCSSVGCSESSNYSSQAIAPPLRLIRFEPDPLVDNIMDWFCRHHLTPSVHTLDIYRLALNDSICNFIRHLGSALENLTIWGPTTSRDFDQIGAVRSKFISDPYFIDASLITFISRSIPEYFSSQNLLSVVIRGSIEVTHLWLDYSHRF
jgi:hypothetical protein